MKVLIIDKDSKEVEMIKNNLGSEDYAVFEVENSEAMLEHLKDEDKPQIIFADFEMPDFGGMELINCILAANLNEYPYIIFLTPSEGENQVIDVLGPIPGDFLVKPINEAGLKARLAIAERTLAMQARLRDKKGHSESLALYDQLTSVLNRQAVYERALGELNRAQREEVPVGIAMLEVANLIKIHEEYGPEVRDQAVRFVARAARANVRIYDLVGRWLGAKFLLMLPGISLENSRMIFTRIHKAITTIRVRVPDGERLKLDVRIGFTGSNRDNSLPLYGLIEQANTALEQANASAVEPIILFQETV